MIGKPMKRARLENKPPSYRAPCSTKRMASLNLGRPLADLPTFPGWYGPSILMFSLESFGVLQSAWVVEGVSPSLFRRTGVGASSIAL